MHSDASGIDAVLEVVAELLLAILLAVFAFIVAVVVSAWLGAIVGCGAALRVFGYPGAKRTAMVAGLIGPVVVFALAKLADALVGPSGDGDFYFAVGVGVTVSALAARRLATGPAQEHSFK